jgi:hypothetical protein
MHSGWSVAALSVLEGAKNRDPHTERPDPGKRELSGNATRCHTTPNAFICSRLSKGDASLAIVESSTMPLGSAASPRNEAWLEYARERETT